jgi:MYXO-CTERM domain-containing protein
VNDAGFKVGETFTDPAGGLSITLQSMDAEKAVIKVEIDNGSGDPTCLDGTTLDPPTGPIKCVGGGDAGAPAVEAGVDSGRADAPHEAAPPEAAPSAPEAGNVEIPVDSSTSPSGHGPALGSHGDISDVEGGCSCRVGGRPSTPRGTWLAALVGCVIVSRRLQRRRTATSRSQATPALSSRR